MTQDIPVPNDRASFRKAITEVRAEHAVLRHLAEAVSERSVLSTDDVLSLAEAVKNHERSEAILFSLPFLSRPPEAVTKTAAKSQERCEEYLSGRFSRVEAATAASRFVDALLAHIAAEENWLDREDEHQKERLRTAA